ncbi:hypothetical protein QBC46DRAFT_17224 [Diplogelasinospora grovesii]|uniref:Heterokaryon incompatibility domain-containing protein n=1 Tax=Diplogelasinospora grovesii TaxID=303347 RepID=A0AAN6N0W4_9PEZI|nr:hypothetical protein QBC46DRAFT_17224 [Diplogelasinospora grovesii]
MAAISKRPQLKRKRSFHGTDHPQERQDNERTTFPGGLCKRCHTIPWSELRHSLPSSRIGKFVTFLTESHRELSLSSCRVCQLLAILKPASLDLEICHLRVLSARRVFETSNARSVREASFSDCSLLCVYPSKKNRTVCNETGYLAVLDQDRKEEDSDFGPRLISPGQIDFKLVRHWLSFCRRKHNRACTEDRREDTHGLQVIDCERTTVIPAPPRCQYIALSYVWGPNPAAPQQNNGLALNKLPPGHPR